MGFLECEEWRREWRKEEEEGNEVKVWICEKEKKEERNIRNEKEREELIIEDILIIGMHDEGDFEIRVGICRKEWA